MATLVIGQQNSGKSQFAEDLVLKYPAARRYYLATMKVLDDEGRERIKRHRAQREGKGFETIELEYGIDRAVEMINSPGESVVLLECIANLVGNEMYDNPDRKDLGENDFAQALMRDISFLADHVAGLVIVTNEYIIDEMTDEETRKYISLIDLMNVRLKEYADKVYRIGDGWIKGTEE